MTHHYSDDFFTLDDAPGTDWSDYPFVRWFSQLASGILPGILVVWAVIQVASHTPSANGTNNCAASVVPLLGLDSTTDNRSFHRFSFDHHSTVDASPKFRIPDPDRRNVTSTKHTLTVTKRVTALPVKFDAPRQTWTHLDTSIRKDIDVGLRASAQPWQRVVLHGSGTASGNATLLDRYHRDIHRISDGLAYHFVIGNGARSPDGTVEASARWLAGHSSGDTQDPGLQGSISVCLVGDFNAQPPTAAQLSALDELLDYLSVKLGNVPVTTHHMLSGNEASCLGSHFPEDALMHALSTPSL